MGHKNKTTTGRLTELLKDDSELVRIEAMKSLAKFNSSHNQVLRVLEGMVEENERVEKVFVVITLNESSAAPFYPLLERLLDRWNREVLETIKALGPTARHFLPQLKKLINQADDQQTFLVQAAISIGSDDQELIEKIIASLDLSYSIDEAVEMFDDYAKR